MAARGRVMEAKHLGVIFRKRKKKYLLTSAYIYVGKKLPIFGYKMFTGVRVARLWYRQTWSCYWAFVRNVFVLTFNIRSLSFSKGLGYSNFGN